MLKFETPDNHKAIVNSLLKGKFILIDKDRLLFETIIQYKVFYTDFFKLTFGYQLITRNKFCYLISDKSDEKLSKTTTIFIAILCYELDRVGGLKSIKETFDYTIFDVSEVKKLLDDSTYNSIVYNNDKLNNLQSFIRELGSRNIVERINEDKFKFTDAIELFFEFSIELIKNKNKGNN